MNQNMRCFYITSFIIITYFQRKGKGASKETDWEKINQEKDECIKVTIFIVKFRDKCFRCVHLINLY